MKTLIYEDGNEKYEIYINSGDNSQGGSKSIVIDTEMLKKAQRLMKGYALFAINSFRNLGKAKASEIILEFGVTLGGKSQVPFISEGSASSDLKVTIKFNFPNEH